jgi:hypothetical protein
LEQLRFLFQDRNKFVRAESGVGGENDRLKTIQEHVKTRTFSAESAEKIRHPASLHRGLGQLWCRAERMATAKVKRAGETPALRKVDSGRRESVGHPAQGQKSRPFAKDSG